MNNVIVLNADYRYVNTISWQDAACLLFKGAAEAAIPLEVPEEMLIPGFTYTAADVPYRIVRGVRRNFVVPLVIRLRKYVRQIFKSKVPFSRTNVFIRDSYECQYCGASVTDKTGELEHVVPISRSGPTSYENCVTACNPCNKRKGNRTPEEAGMSLRKRAYHQPTINEWFESKMERTGVTGILKELGLR